MKLKHTLIALIYIISIFSKAQNDEINKTNSNNSKNKIDYFDYVLDDIFFVAGINRGGVFWSNHYASLNDENGFNIGVETYTPVSNKVFLNYGLGYTQRSFSHSIKFEDVSTNVLFQNHFIEVPLYFSFELPVFREFDFRFNLGAQFAYRLSTSQKKEYPSAYLDNGNFAYNINAFNSFDGGMNFGLSAEYNGFYLRLRNASGNASIYRNEQGMLHAFYIDFGYFFIRKIRDIKNDKE